MKLTVVHLEGAKQGQTEHAPGPVVTLGRDPSCEIAFDAFKDLDVSTRHASVTFQGDQVLLQDLGSKNGTFLNGVRIQGAVPVPQDAVIQLGEKGPKVKVSYLHGPGKKTEMLNVLTGKLDQAEKAQASARTRTRLLGCCLLLVILGSVGGFFLWSSLAEAKRLKLAVLGTADSPGLKADAEREREKARKDGAHERKEAAERWKAAEEAFQAGEAALAAESWEPAGGHFKRAAAAYEDARDAARDARDKAIQAEAERRAKEAEEARRKEQERLLKEIEEAKKKAAEEAARRLQAAMAEDLLRELERLLQSSNPDDVKEGVTRARKELEKRPDDQQLKDLLAKLEERWKQLQNVDQRLIEAAKAAKPSVVMVFAHTFAIPGGQRLDSTNIRVTVARQAGSGFFTSPDGRLLTSREVAEPWLFDGAALALHKKLTERNMQFFTHYEVWSAASGSGYRLTYGTDKVKHLVSGRSAPGATRKVKIHFENVETEVEVAPHVRDAEAVSLLQVSGPDVKPLALAGDDASTATPLVALGCQRGGPDMKPDEVGLFQFRGKVKTKDKVLALEVPAFPAWRGGPVLDADGRVLGLIVDTGTRESTAISAGQLKGFLSR